MERGLVGAVLVLLLAAVASPGAAQDVGCADFAWQEAAQVYFVSGGGSAAYDFAGLDPDHDGLACEDTLDSCPVDHACIDDGEAIGGVPPGGLPQPTEAPPPVAGAPPAEEAPVDGAPVGEAPPVVAAEEATGTEGSGAAAETSGGGGEVAVSALPDTGAGADEPAGHGTPAWPLVAVAAVVLGVIGRRAVRLGY